MVDKDVTLGAFTSIGGTILELFPHGFLIDSYIARQAVRYSLTLVNPDAPGQEPEFFHDEKTIKAFLSKYKKQESLISEKLDAYISQEIERHDKYFVEQSVQSKPIESTKYRHMNTKYKITPAAWKSRNFLKTKLPRRISAGVFEKKFLTLPFSPFDIFAVVAKLLRDSGAYHHVQPESKRVSDAEPLGRSLSLSTEEMKKWTEIGENWRLAQSPRTMQSLAPDSESINGISEEVLILWAEIISAWNYPVFRAVPSDSNSNEDPNNECPHWWLAAYKLLIVCDRASRDTGFAHVSPGQEFEVGYEDIPKGGAWAFFASLNLLKSNVDYKYEDVVDKIVASTNSDERGLMRLDTDTICTLSAANRDDVCVMPKSRTAQIGCTLRSLSHNLCLLPSRGLVRANWAYQSASKASTSRLGRKPFNLLVIPYPFSISASQFKPVSRVHNNQKHGSFDFVPESTSSDLILEYLSDLIETARMKTGRVDGVVFPELSLSAYQFDSIYKYLKEETEVELLCAGLNQRYPVEKRGTLESKDVFPSDNFAALCSFKDAIGANLDDSEEPSRDDIMCTYQKHHRWKLDEEQIKSYGLSSALDPSIKWWEDRRIMSRKLPILAMRNLWSVTTLVCEDLARVDPAQQIVRSIGPNLILALLLDGPQLTNRWSARYATVLAEDPGSAVLTVSSVGLIRRTESVRFFEKGIKPESRSIALWRDDKLETDIKIGMHDHAAILTLYEYTSNELTIDGRRNGHNSTVLRLGNYSPLKLREHVREIPNVSSF